MSDQLLQPILGKFGFGLMRLPMRGDKIDIAQTQAMVDCYLDKGYNYFDTAYGYHDGQSEEAIREVLVKRYNRDRFLLATKLPLWLCKTPEDMQSIINTQLERTGAGYFDFYLAHALSASRMEDGDRVGAWRFMQELKEKGVARHIGFSFHDTADVLDQFLTQHPEFEFVQLQINYVDWASPKVQSKACYEVARKHGKPVIVMEPIKGGMLSELSPGANRILSEANAAATPTSWALRFAASLDGVLCILSGMSTLEQMRQNLELMEDPAALSEQDYKILDAVRRELERIDTIPCTSCGYCVTECPLDIKTPDMIRLLNNYKQFNFIPPLLGNYKVLLRDQGGGRAGDCIACGSCENVCPQQIPIIETLKTVSSLLDQEVTT